MAIVTTDALSSLDQDFLFYFFETASFKKCIFNILFTSLQAVSQNLVSFSVLDRNAFEITEKN